MKPIIFDGRRFQEEKIKVLKPKAEEFFDKNGRRPCLVIFLGNELQSRIFTRMKAKFGRKIGVDVRTIKIKNEEQLRSMIEMANESDEVDGIMIQLPLTFSNPNEFIKLIVLNKDVDGMRENSRFLPAVARGIKEVLQSQIYNFKLETRNLFAAVIGAKGWVGKNLLKMLSELKFKKIIAIDKGTKMTIKDLKKADIVFSCVGKPEIICGDLLKDKVMVFDLGVGKPDFEFLSTVKKAKFLTPVPGGLGPVTIASLFGNLLNG